jgi:2-C-methyl-D-erythritol 4-phosphate cytidylyltransferase
LNALGAITDDSGVTGVHDGVRPFVTPEVIDRCFNAAKQDGAAIPVIFPADSIREADDKGSHARNRDRFRLVQTPQVFRTDLLKKAYSNGYRESFTDDASVVEAAGHAITLVEGNQENIKITSPFDMMVAHVIVSGDCDQKG